MSLESGQSSLIIHSVKCIVIVKLNKWYIYSCYKRVNILRKRERDIYINDIYVNDKICIYDNKKIGILIGANIIEWVFWKERVYPAIKKCTHKSFYFLMNWRSIKKMEEEKRVMATFSLCYRKLPNAEHSCAGHETSLMFSLRAFFLQVINVSTFR